MRWLMGFLLVGGLLALTTRLSAQQEGGQGTVVTLDGLKSRTPGTWIEVPSKGMRYKQFRLPAAGGDKGEAELIIFYFGPGQGGGAEENIKRWKGFFEPPQGKQIDDMAKKYLGRETYPWRKPGEIRIKVLVEPVVVAG